MTLLKPGTKAPHFNLHSTPDQKLSLSDFKGHPVILVFYPSDWSPVCTDQLSLYNEILPDFSRYQAALLAISVDGPWCHLAFERDRELQFPLLSDFDPKGKVAQDYGVYHEKGGIAERAIYVIDPQGIIQWSYLSPMGVNPGAEGILNALEKMQKK